MDEFGVRSTACWCGSTNVRTHTHTFFSQINFSTQCIATYCYNIRTRKEQKRREKPHNDDCASEMTWTIITFLKWLNKFTCPCRFAVFNGLFSLYLTHTHTHTHWLPTIVPCLWISSLFRLCCFASSSFSYYHFQFFPLLEKLFGSSFPRSPFAIVVVVVFLGGNYSHKLTIQLVCVCMYQCAIFDRKSQGGKIFSVLRCIFIVSVCCKWKITNVQQTFAIDVHFEPI